MPQTNQNKIGILFPNISSPIYDSLFPAGDRPNNAWILSKATQYGAKLTLYPQYPRPTGEVSSFASHLFAHSTMTYELYPKAFGGCWPYRWSLITGPAGMAIGNELDRTSDSGLTLHTVGSGLSLASGSLTNPSFITVSTTAPASPVVNQLWLDIN